MNFEIGQRARHKGNNVDISSTTPYTQPQSS